MQDHILFGFKITEQQDEKIESQDKLLDCLRANHLAWVHLDADHPDTPQWLRQNFTYLDPLIVEALLAPNTRPRVEEIGDGALVILRGVNLNENAAPEDMVSLRLWIDENRIISLERRPIYAVRHLADQMTGAASVKNAGDFLVQICARLFQNMEPFVTNLSEELDDIEEELSEHFQASRRADIVELRKKAIIFKRYFTPQRDMMMYLKTSPLSWITESHRRHIQENQDRLLRYVEDLDAIRERAQIIKDEIANILSEKLNKNLYILSVITAIFLPLSFLTGLLGINVGGLPGTDNPDAFWIVCAAGASLGLIQLIIFKFFRWL